MKLEELELTGVEFTSKDGQTLTLSLEDAKKLFGSLDRLFGKEKEYIYPMQQYYPPYPCDPCDPLPYRSPSVYPPVTYPTITCSSDNETKVKGSYTQP